MSNDSVEKQVEIAFKCGAKAVSIWNGKLAPWSPFGVDSIEYYKELKKYREQSDLNKENK